MQSNFISTVFLGVSVDLEFPKELKDFLSIDDQGMDGFLFMIKNPKLKKRIPEIVLLQYISLLSSVNQNLNNELDGIREEIKGIEDNKDNIINDIISDVYLNSK